eukprot:g26711.t1
MNADNPGNAPDVESTPSGEFVEDVELAGHIVDSLLLPKVLDEIIAHGGQFDIRDVQIGKRRADPSHALLRVTAPTAEQLDEVLVAIGQHGAIPIHDNDCRLVPAETDGVFPEGFYTTTNQDTEVRIDGKWIPVRLQEMDCGVRVRMPNGGKPGAECVPMSDVKQGDAVIVGRVGTRVKPVGRDRKSHDVFGFMNSTVSSEKPKGVTVREIAAEMKRAKDGDGKILIVGGPAIVHTGSRHHVSEMIRHGFVNVLFAGNALATHDIEQSFYDTSLGISMTSGGSIEEGHEHHLRSINRIRRAGGIREAVDSGLLTGGIMYECVKNDVPYLLAGSIRDDGPLPDVITDVIEAQRKMREMISGVTFALMIATTLHSIAVGNLLPARVKVVWEYHESAASEPLRSERALDPTIVTIAILAAGIVVVIGGVLFFKLHAFLALLLGAAVVAALTPQASVESYALERDKLLKVEKHDGASGDIPVSEEEFKKYSQATIFLLIRKSGDTGKYAVVGEYSRQKSEDLPEGFDALHPVKGETAAPEPQSGDLLVLPSAWDDAQKLGKQSFAARVANGFGETCTKIGILIALASIIGICLLESGSADRIVRSLLNKLGEKGAPFSFLSSGFLLGIPVFFDTVFYLMIPLGKAMRMRVGRNYLLYVLTIVAGATMAHSLVPPTPGPLFVAQQLGVDIGVMILAGGIVGIFTAGFGYFYASIANRIWDLPLRESPDCSLEELEEITKRDESQLPAFWLALLPIVLPVVLIGGNTVLSRFKDSLSADIVRIAGILGDKNIALGISAAIAMATLVKVKRTNLQALADSVQSALSSGGVIILITAAGGAFGGVLKQTGVSGLIGNLSTTSPIAVIGLAFLITTAIRTAQGSATVAMITAVGILSGLAASGQLDFHPVYLALAIGCGSKPIGWMNDSGFWVITKMSGMTEGEGLKYVTPMTSLMGVVGDSRHDIKPIVCADSLDANIGTIYSRVVGQNNAKNGMPTNALLFPRAVDPSTMPGITQFGKFPSTGEFGSAYAPFVPGTGGDMQQNMKLKMPMNRLGDRRGLLRQLDRAKWQFESNAAGMDHLRKQAFDTILGGVAEAFDLSKEDQKLVSRYDTSPLVRPEDIDKKWNNHKRYADNGKTLGKLLLLARRLCESGCGFVTVTTNFVWDMHADRNNATCEEGMRYMGRPFDHAVSAFLEDVEARGLSDKILLVCCGEMGRTPRVNKRGGRDHWGNLAPLMLAGGGLNMGQVIGQSTRDVGQPLTTPITKQNLIGTILHTLFDVSELRIASGVPNSISQKLASYAPIPGLS